MLNNEKCYDKISPLLLGLYNGNIDSICQLFKVL